MRIRTDPFTLAGGHLLLDGLPLRRLADDLQGAEELRGADDPRGVGAAWLVGAAAVRAALSGAGAPATVAVDRLGPPALLAMAAAQGCWAAVTSSHELSLATAAGFPGARIVVRGRVKDDGLLAAALGAGAGVVEPADDDDAANLRRIADGLGRPRPAPAGAPPDLAEDALAACGGLFARALRGTPTVALDAAWPVDEGGAVVIWPLSPGEPRAATLEGLAGCGGPVAALARGEVSRGDWALVPWSGAASPRRPDLRHPETPTVLVDGERWRLLEPRPLPPSPGG